MISTSEPRAPVVSLDDLTDCGYRYVERELEDGTIVYDMIPLTEREYLHPEEGYHLPTSVFHTTTIITLHELLLRWYAENPSVGVFSDLQIVWDMPALEPHSPDVCVVFGIKDKSANRRRFLVAEEGVRPRLIVEVVSPRYRTADRVTKVEEYERAGVLEYVIVDRRQQRGELVMQLLGYRLSSGRYHEIISDDQGRVFCESVNLFFSVREGTIVVEDAASGERLLTPRELETRMRAEEAARVEAELRAGEEAAAREMAELRAGEEAAARATAEAQVATLQVRLAELERERGERD